MFPYSASELKTGARHLSLDHVFPEYGTDAFKSSLHSMSDLTSEIAVLSRKISMRCTLDEALLEGKQGSAQEATGMIISLDNAVVHVVHVTSDNHGITRIGAGSSGAFFIDESRTIADVLTLGKGASRKIT
jgi:hypothetical protein